jgi:hypothetical protein
MLPSPPKSLPDRFSVPVEQFGDGKTVGADRRVDKHAQSVDAGGLIAADVFIERPVLCRDLANGQTPPGRRLAAVGGLRWNFLSF